MATALTLTGHHEQALSIMTNIPYPKRNDDKTVQKYLEPEWYFYQAYETLEKQA